MFDGAYRGCRVLLTGHTGFKGSWLALWLARLGADVAGLALAPSTTPSHWTLLRLPLARDLRVDVRDAPAVAAAVREFAPQAVFHLAAQPLVRHSYQDPLGTWATNVMGTAHLLQACREAPSVRAVVAVTTDKCYRNPETGRALMEDDPLGGHDPYSASKAGAELVVASYRQSYFAPAGAPLVASARAGNVIGGGDWSVDRLVPDAVRAVAAGVPLAVRHPEAVRPWQHVLDSLSGYLLLGQGLLQGRADRAAAWNFGPREHASCAVGELLGRLQAHWPALAWRHERPAEAPHEAKLLRLDIARAEQQLGWAPVWDLEATVARTAAWYRAFAERGTVASAEQLADYEQAAHAAGLAWARG